jgi:hypothetical protein
LSARRSGGMPFLTRLKAIGSGQTQRSNLKIPRSNSQTTDQPGWHG